MSVRSSNCLKRSGYTTVGDLVRAFSEGLDLKNIRYCGSKSIREKKEKLFLYHYYFLAKERRERYLLEVILMNA